MEAAVPPWVGYPNEEKLKEEILSLSQVGLIGWLNNAKTIIKVDSYHIQSPYQSLKNVLFWILDYGVNPFIIITHSSVSTSNDQLPDT
jgi:hypothetical protein